MQCVKNIFKKKPAGAITAAAGQSIIIKILPARRPAMPVAPAGPTAHAGPVPLGCSTRTTVPARAAARSYSTCWPTASGPASFLSERAPGLMFHRCTSFAFLFIVYKLSYPDDLLTQKCTAPRLMFVQSGCRRGGIKFFSHKSPFILIHSLPLGV